jgi:hypothetical protein
MVSKHKALSSLAISSGVIIFRHCIYRDLPDLSLISPLLILYCLLDLRNTPSMVLHHIATVLLNVTFWFVAHNIEYLDDVTRTSVGQIVGGFFDLETSTILLAFMHLGYRHLYLKLLFVATFVYYRLINLGGLLMWEYDPRYITDICRGNNFCYYSWYLGCPPLVLLNYYWAYQIFQKLFKYKKPT